MADKDKTPIDIISVLEQLEGSLVNFAPVMASYYSALIKSGIPSDLATKLTIEWHNAFWTYHFRQGNK